MRDNHGFVGRLAEPIDLAQPRIRWCRESAVVPTPPLPPGAAPSQPITNARAAAASAGIHFQQEEPMFFKQLLRSSIVRFSLIAVMLSLGIFISMQLTGHVEAATPLLSNPIDVEQSSTVSSASPETIHAQHVCTIADVMVDVARIHVRCTAANTDGMQFFAVSTADTKHTARVLALLLTAQATGKTIEIFYNQNDTSGNTFGCLAADCRLILFVKMLN